jgi:hypothetical protein
VAPARERADRLAVRLRLLLLIAATAVATCVLEAPVASASCVPPRPAPLLRDADAAFVGRLVETQPDRWIFAVDERVKGDLGATVAVTRGAITSVSLTPEPGRRVGLLLQGSAEAGWTSNSCVQLSPAQLRAAAADPDAPCLQPRIRSVRFRLPGRVDVALGGLDDSSTNVMVRWGDGTTSTRRVGRGARRRTVVVRHAYRKRGTHRVRVSVAARPALACGSFVEGVVAAPIVVRT